MPVTVSTLQAKLVRKTEETADICSFEFQSLDGAALPTFEAGAHIDVHLPQGVIRQYSLCNPLTGSHSYEVAVLRDSQSRGGSIGMHALREGDVLTLSVPRNHFPVRMDGVEHHVLFAGGIGITPIWAMAQTLAAQGASFELHYCTRSPAAAALAPRIRDSAWADRAHFYHDSEAQKLDVAAVLARHRSDRVHLYVCGPSGFMDWVLEAGQAAGWSSDRLHREYFSAPSIDTSGDGSFEVRIASSGAVLRVPADLPISAVLLQHGIPLSTSCEQGVCGTCIVRVLDGIPDHRDMYLTDEERLRNDQFTPCCSRSQSPCLVLDL